jgi:5-methylcytosine-specific restriction endonuclease McrA
MAHCTHEAIVIDHIIPGRVGGSQDDMNLRAACWRCNQDRRNHTNTPTPTHQEYW